MKTKEEIAANMHDPISLGKCFFGEEESDADRQVYLNMMADIRGIIEEERSITASTKRFFDELFGMQFDETQWLGLTLLITVYIELAERRGAGKLAEAMSLLDGGS